MSQPKPTSSASELAPARDGLPSHGVAADRAAAADNGTDRTGASGAGAAAGRNPTDRGLTDIWRSFSDPRRATCLAWLAFLITWVITRLITSHGKGSDDAAAIIIAGHHIHHYLLGLILMGIVAALALFWRPAKGWEWLGLGYGVALALILDEYALLLNLSDVYWDSQGKLSVDVVLGFLAAGGAYIAGMTLVHESLRRARRRLRHPLRHRR